jgi:hypothetical protein
MVFDVLKLCIDSFLKNLTQIYAVGNWGDHVTTIRYMNI